MQVPLGADIVGMKFGRWTIDSLFSTVNYIKRYKCVCDCGNIKVVVRSQILKGASKSCGCLRTEGIINRSTTHGMSRSPEYKVYTSMVNRCTNKEYLEYDLYGGRGIKVSSLWDTFEKFYAYMGPRPSIGWQLDRIDNEKGYEPGNVKWATKTQNARNKRNTVYVDYLGVKTPLKEVAEKTGVDYHALFYRYQKGLTGSELIAPSAKSK